LGVVCPCTVQYARPSSCVRASLPFVFIFHVLDLVMVARMHGQRQARATRQRGTRGAHVRPAQPPRRSRRRRAPDGDILISRGDSRENLSTRGDVSAHVRLHSSFHVFNQHQHAAKAVRSTCRAKCQHTRCLNLKSVRGTAFYTATAQVHMPCSSHICISYLHLAKG